MSELWGQGHSPCTPLRPPTLGPTTTGSEQQARTHTQGLADGCGPHCLRGPDHHCTLPATPQGVLPSPHLPLTPGPGLFRAVVHSAFFKGYTAGDKGRGKHPAPLPRGGWHLAGQAHLCISVVFPLVGSLPEAVSFHHKGLNHTDPSRSGRALQKAPGELLSAGLHPGTMVTRVLTKASFDRGTLSVGPSSRPLGPSDQVPQTPRLILAPSPDRTDWQLGMFCRPYSLTISQFQTLASRQDTGNFHKDTNKDEGCNFCRNCWCKPVCSGMLSSQGAPQADLGGLLSLLLLPNFPSRPKGGAWPPLCPL